MRKVLVFVGVVVALVATACDPAEEITAPPSGDVVDIDDAEYIGLVTEDGCGELLEWMKRESTAYVSQGEMSQRRDPGAVETTADAAATSGGEESAPAPSAAQRASGAETATDTPVAGTDFSTTNVQEEGVDEPDVVKTDGRLLVTIANGQLRFVDVSGGQPELRASLTVAGAHALLLARDRVLAIGSQATYYPLPGRAEPMPAPMVDDERAGADVAIAPVPGYSEPKTTVTVIDVADLGAPRIVSTVELDGSYVAARLTDGVARVVLRSTPNALVQPQAATTIDDWVPQYTYTEPGRDESTVDGQLVPCDRVHHPRGFTGPEMLTVVAIDPEDARPGNGASVAGAGETVYASHDRLYVTSQQWGGPTGERVSPSTEIHAFDVADEVTTTYVGSGSVEGTLLNQFSLSEHDGVLRVATTFADGTTGQSESQVVALRDEGGALKQIGAIRGLGKTERIYAVRFLGAMGYVVTFRQTDPLYILDLSDPTAPALKGELKIPGYSAYLHPIAEGRLLGIGQNATDRGQRLGAQVSLFDVSDPASPKQIATHDLGGSSSMAEYDHHAFLWWAKTKLAVVPVEGQALRGGAPCPPGADCIAPTEYRPGALGLTVDGDRFAERGRVEHPTRMPITRSLVIGDSLMTISESGLLDSNLDTLATESWLGF